MIHELEYIVRRYIPTTNDWNEIRHELDATEGEMDEAFDEVAEFMAGDLESDVEVMAEDWMDRHAYSYMEDVRSTVEKLVAERLEDDD
jgi:hypothetical protein